MTHMLLACATLSDDSSEPELAVALAVEEIGRRVLASYASIDPDRLTPSGRRRNRPGQATVEALGEAAELIARRGAGLCLWPGCDAERPLVMLMGPERFGVLREAPKYCPEHLDRKPDEKERHAKLIERAREAAAESLPMLEEQVRSLTESSARSVGEQAFDLPQLAQRPRAWHTSRVVSYPRTGFNVDWDQVHSPRM
jgi:hypothetical protein